MKITVIAIDPGVSGGIAVSQFGQSFCYPMPETQSDVFTLLEEIRNNAVREGCNVRCFVESVPLYCGPGRQATVAVTFDNFGYVKGCLRALLIPTELVRPQDWQGELGMGTSGRKRLSKQMTPEQRKAQEQTNDRLKREWKRKLREDAQRRYPHLAATLKTGDALLLLTYGIAKTHPSNPQPRIA